MISAYIGNVLISLAQSRVLKRTKATVLTSQIILSVQSTNTRSFNIISPRFEAIAMADEFTLNGFREPVTVDLAKMITHEKLLKFAAFRNWKETLQKNLELQYIDKDHAFSADPYVLKRIEIQSVDYFSPTKIGFIKLKADIRNRENKALPGIAFLRGGSVAMLMVLRPVDSRDERWVVMTEQPRVPAGSLKFVEIPAGMLDDAGDFRGQAAKEIEEETGFKLPKHELIDLTKLALSQSNPESECLMDESLQDAMYPSPGGSDEYIPILLWEKVLLSIRILGTKESNYITRN